MTCLPAVSLPLEAESLDEPQARLSFLLTWDSVMVFAAEERKKRRQARLHQEPVVLHEGEAEWGRVGQSWSYTISFQRETWETISRKRAKVPRVAFKLFSYTLG